MSCNYKFKDKFYTEDQIKDFIKRRIIKSDANYTLYSKKDEQQLGLFNDETNESEILSEKLTYKTIDSINYAERTKINAKESDVTIHFALDFNTAGERLTKNSVEKNNKLYIPIAINSNILNLNNVNFDTIITQLNNISKKDIIINVAGNGIYTLNNYTQEDVDNYTYNFFNKLLNHPNLNKKIKLIRSGGQTGFDESGIKAGLALNIPTLILSTKDWKFRLKNNNETKDWKFKNNEITNEELFKARFDNYTLIPIYQQLNQTTSIVGNVVKFEGKNYTYKDAELFANSLNGIVSTRNFKSEFHYGNPFTSDKKLAEQQNLILTNSTKESVEKYIDWVLNSTEERAKWIREKLISGELKNKPIIYHKELNEPSHANALDYLINIYDWSNYNNVQTKQFVENIEQNKPIIYENDTLYYNKQLLLDLNLSEKIEFENNLDTLFVDDNTLIQFYLYFYEWAYKYNPDNNQKLRNIDSKINVTRLTKDNQVSVGRAFATNYALNKLRENGVSGLDKIITKYGILTREFTVDAKKYRNNVKDLQMLFVQSDGFIGSPVPEIKSTYDSSTKLYQKLWGELGNNDFSNLKTIAISGSGTWNPSENGGKITLENIEKHFNEFYIPLIEKAIEQGVIEFRFGNANGIDQLVLEYFKTNSEFEIKEENRIFRVLKTNSIKKELYSTNEFKDLKRIEKDKIIKLGINTIFKLHNDALLNNLPFGLILTDEKLNELKTEIKNGKYKTNEEYLTAIKTDILYYLAIYFNNAAKKDNNNEYYLQLSKFYLNNREDIYKELVKELKYFGFKITDNKIEITETNSESDEYYDTQQDSIGLSDFLKEKFEVSPELKANNYIKLSLALIPKYVNNELQRDEHGLTIYEDYKTLYKILQEYLKDSFNVDDMIKKLNRRSETNLRYGNAFKHILSQIEKSENYKIKFYNSLHLSNQNFITVRYNKQDGFALNIDLNEYDKKSKQLIKEIEYRVNFDKIYITNNNVTYKSLIDTNTVTLPIYLEFLKNVLNINLTQDYIKTFFKANTNYNNELNNIYTHLLKIKNDKSKIFTNANLIELVNNIASLEEDVIESIVIANENKPYWKYSTPKHLNLALALIKNNIIDAILNPNIAYVPKTNLEKKLYIIANNVKIEEGNNITDDKLVTIIEKKFNNIQINTHLSTIDINSGKFGNSFDELKDIDKEISRINIVLNGLRQLVTGKSTISLTPLLNFSDKNTVLYISNLYTPQQYSKPNSNGVYDKMINLFKSNHIKELERIIKVKNEIDTLPEHKWVLNYHFKYDKNGKKDWRLANGLQFTSHFNEKFQKYILFENDKLIIDEELQYLLSVEYNNNLKILTVKDNIVVPEEYVQSLYDITKQHKDFTKKDWIKQGLISENNRILVNFINNDLLSLYLKDSKLIEIYLDYQKYVNRYDNLESFLESNIKKKLKQSERIAYYNNIQNNIANIENVLINKILTDYVLNYISSAQDLTYTFHGDPTLYKSLDDLDKRTAALITDGYYNSDINNSTFKVQVLFDEVSNSETGLAYNYYKELFKSRFKHNSEGLKRALKPFTETNITDGQGYITAERFKQIQIEQGLWNDDKNVTFNKLMNGEEIPFRELNVFMQPLKGVYFSVDKNGIATYLKYSQAVLFPNFVKNNSELKKLYDKMIRTGVHEVVYNSAIKVGERGTVTFDEFINTDVDYSFELENKFWKLQVPLPTKGIKDSLLATQQKSNIQANITENMIFESGRNGKQWLQEHNHIISALSDIGRQQMILDLGLEFVNGQIVIKNDTKVKNSIIAQLDTKNDVDEDIYKSLELENGKFKHKLSSNPYKNIFIPILTSMVKKYLVDIKVNGGSFVQISTQGITKFVEFNNQKGIEYIYDKLQPAQYDTATKTFIAADVFLPYSFKIDLGLEGKTKEEIASFLELNKDILKGITYRIPGQSKASINNIRIAGFLPPEIGDSIVLYEDVTALTGSDFDIDKMYAILPELKHEKILKNNVELQEVYYTKEQILEDNKIYVFGDNFEDAKNQKEVSQTQAVIRNKKNAFGISTKNNRFTNEDSFLSDDNFEELKNYYDQQFSYLRDQQNKGKIIVFPKDGIGTGKAMLKQKAPKLNKYLQNQINNLLYADKLTLIPYLTNANSTVEERYFNYIEQFINNKTIHQQLNNEFDAIKQELKNEELKFQEKLKENQAIKKQLKEENSKLFENFKKDTKEIKKQINILVKNNKYKKLLLDLFYEKKEENYYLKDLNDLISLVTNFDKFYNTLEQKVDSKKLDDVIDNLENIVDYFLKLEENYSNLSITEIKEKQKSNNDKITELNTNRIEKEKINIKERLHNFKYDLYLNFAKRYNLYTLSEFNNLTIEKQNSKKALTNRIIYNYHDLYTNENVFIEANTPIDSLDIHKYSKDLDQIDANLEFDNNIFYYFNPVKQRSNNTLFQNGKKLVGIVANAIKNHATMQVNHIGLGENLTSVDHIFDINGNYVTDVLSALLNGAVDVVKNPSLVKNNFNLLTANVGIYLIRSNTMDVFTTFSYLRQDILKYYKNVIDTYESNFTERKYDNGKYLDSSKLTQTYISDKINSSTEIGMTQYISENGKSIEYSDIDIQNRLYLINQLELKDLFKQEHLNFLLQIKEQNKNSTYWTIQSKIFESYLMFNYYGKILASVSNLLKFDVDGAGSSAKDVYNNRFNIRQSLTIQKNYQNAISKELKNEPNNLLLKELLEEHKKLEKEIGLHTDLSVINNVDPKLIESMQRQFALSIPYTYDVLQSYFYDFDDIIEQSFNLIFNNQNKNDVGNKKIIIETVLDSLQLNNNIQFALTKLPNKDDVFSESFNNKISNLKFKYPDNIFLQYLTSNKYTTSDETYTYFTLNIGKIDPRYKERIKNDLEELYVNEKELIQQLLKQSLLRPQNQFGQLLQYFKLDILEELEYLTFNDNSNINLSTIYKFNSTNAYLFPKVPTRYDKSKINNKDLIFNNEDIYSFKFGNYVHANELYYIPIEFIQYEDNLYQLDIYSIDDNFYKYVLVQNNVINGKLYDSKLESNILQPIEYYNKLQNLKQNKELMAYDEFYHSPDGLKQLREEGQKTQQKRESEYNKLNNESNNLNEKCLGE